MIFKAEFINHEEQFYSYPAYRQQHREATSRLLGRLALKNYWPSIQELQISINVGAEDLVHFLLGASQTLCRLALESVALTPGSKTLEETFESLSRGLRLKSFKFRCLEENGILGVTAQPSQNQKGRREDSKARPNNVEDPSRIAGGHVTPHPFTSSYGLGRMNL